MVTVATKMEIAKTGQGVITFQPLKRDASAISNELESRTLKNVAMLTAIAKVRIVNTTCA